MELFCLCAMSMKRGADVVILQPCNHRIHKRCYVDNGLAEEGMPCPYCGELMEGFVDLIRRNYKRHSLEDRKRVLEATASEEGDWD